MLGGIGSGVGERLLSPAWAWVGRRTLTILTLGVDSASDSIYQEVASGHTEKFSMLIYVFITTLMFLLPIAGLIGLKFSLSERWTRLDKNFDKILATGDRLQIESILAYRKLYSDRLLKF